MNAVRTIEFFEPAKRLPKPRGVEAVDIRTIVIIAQRCGSLGRVLVHRDKSPKEILRH